MLKCIWLRIWEAECRSCSTPIVHWSEKSQKEIYRQRVSNYPKIKYLVSTITFWKALEICMLKAWKKKKRDREFRETTTDINSEETEEGFLYSFVKCVFNLMPSHIIFRQPYVNITLKNFKKNGLMNFPLFILSFYP